MFLARLTSFDGRLPRLDSLYFGRCFVQENGVYNNHQASVWVPKTKEMMFVSLNNNTTNVTSGAETTNPSQAPVLIQVISGVRVFQILDFCVVFCRSLFVLFHLTIRTSSLINI
jgi:hypothetical protein